MHKAAAVYWSFERWKCDKKEALREREKERGERERLVDPVVKRVAERVAERRRGEGEGATRCRKKRGTSVPSKSIPWLVFIGVEPAR